MNVLRQIKIVPIRLFCLKKNRTLSLFFWGRYYFVLSSINSSLWLLLMRGRRLVWLGDLILPPTNVDQVS